MRGCAEEAEVLIIRTHVVWHDALRVLAQQTIKAVCQTGQNTEVKKIKTNDFKTVVGCFYYLLPWEVPVTFEDTFNM